MTYTANRDVALRWIMAYDERDRDEVNSLVTDDFITNVYLEFPAGTYNMGSIVDMRPVARTATGLTVRIVQRVTAEDDYAVKAEKWVFAFDQNKIKSVNDMKRPGGSVRTEITLHEANDIFRSYIGRGEIINMKRLSGTTSGLVYKLESDQGQAYTLKFDDPYQIEMVGRLLATYQSSPLLPKLLYTAPDHSFFIYTFIEGTTHIPQGPKQEWLTKLVKELLNRYEPAPLEAWGRLEYPLESWKRFHEISIEQAKDNIGDILTEEDYTFIQAQVEKWFGPGMPPEEKYVLHGDTGVHNFVFDRSLLAGVIDPSPMAGPLIYDFVYAFCSSPEEISLDTLYGAYEHLEQGRVDKRKLIAEVSVQLYCRVGLSIRHHPHDLPEYLKAWDYWKGIVREEPF